MQLTIEQALHQGVLAHKSGKLQDAERCYQAILNANPLHADANHNLGLLAVAANKTDLALKLFNNAVKANPKIEQFWLSYINLLIQQKHFSKVKRALKKGRRNGLSKQNIKLIESQLISSSIEANLNSKEPSKQQIDDFLVHYENGRFAEALKIGSSLTREFPTHQLSWKILGCLYKKIGMLDDSLLAHKKSVSLQPDDAEAHYNLGNTLQEMERLDEAQESFQRAIELNPIFSEAHYNLGNIYLERNHTEGAEASYKVAIDLQPEFAPAHNNLGSTLKQLGKLKEAEASFKRAIELNPKLAEAHRHLSSMKKFNKEDERLVAMQKIMQDDSVTVEEMCHLNFALAKAFEDLEDFETAFSHYSAGNEQRRSQLNYHIHQDVLKFKRIRKSAHALKENAPKIEKIIKKPTPIFILGMPRSGTTLVEQIVSSHSEVKGAGELPFATEFGEAIATGQRQIDKKSILEFRERYLEKLEAVSEGKFFVTDKMPLNFLLIGLLAAALPEAKILHVKRNNAAVCWGNFKQYFGSKFLGFCYSIDDLVAYHGMYRDLMGFWQKSMTRKILTVDYEFLTVNQETAIKDLINQLELDWEENCLSPETNKRGISTASSLQVRKRIYKGSSQTWKNYKPFLAGKLDKLEHSQD